MTLTINLKFFILTFCYLYIGIMSETLKLESIYSFGVFFCLGAIAMMNFQEKK